VGGIIDKVFPDADAAANAKLELMRLAQAGELAQLNAETSLALGQIETNKVEAANSSLFVSGGRPFILWVCGLALLYVSLVEPVARFVAVTAFSYTGTFPVIDTTITMQLLLGLLGLGGMRTVEKLKGVAR
jgi:hypothetical protein